MASDFESILAEFDRSLGNPEDYLETRSSSIGLKLAKRLYDRFSSVTRSKREVFGPLETLAIEKLDEESVWQELVLHNAPLLGHLEKSCKRLAECRDSLELLPQEHGNAEAGADTAMDDTKVVGRTEEEAGMELDADEESRDIEEEDDDDDATEQGKGAKRRKLNASKVDDKFFKLADMEEFLLLEDKREEKLRTNNRDRTENEEEDIDFFVDIDSETEVAGDDSDIEWDAVVRASSQAVGKGAVTLKSKRHKATRELKYEDFFDPPIGDGEAASSRDTDLQEGSDASGSGYDSEEEESRTDIDSDMQQETDLNSEGDISDNDSPAVLSTHEKRQQMLRQQISQLEEKNMSNKPWQLKGEIVAGHRPENSLLEEDVSFEQTAKTPPVFTEETTEALEDMIKRRIADQAWDDVERKEKPVEQPYEYRKQPVLDQEKSKLSLSEIYEKEYVRQSEEKKDEEERPEYVEIRKLARKLFTKLDALSNFRFTPKPLKEDIRIVTNAPAITVEEVIPAAIADASLLAPEEVHSKPKGNPVGKNERTDTERKRERRLKKQQQKSRAREREQRQKLVAKLKPGLGNKYSQEKAIHDLEKASKSTDKITLINSRDRKDKGAFRSSSAFFERLQEQVSSDIRGGDGNGKKQKKRQGKKTNSSKLKL